MEFLFLKIHKNKSIGYIRMYTKKIGNNKQDRTLLKLISNKRDT